MPEVLTPRLEPIAGAVRRVIEVVNDARFDRRTDEPGSGLGATQVLESVEQATENWFAVTDGFEAALDSMLESQPDSESEVRACQSALMLLHTAVMNEIALLQPLELVVGNPRIADVPEWPSQEDARLEDAAFGSGGLVALLNLGTDDGKEREDPGRGVYIDDVGHAVDVILRRSERAVTGVIAGVTAAPLIGTLHLPAGVPDALREMLERLGEWAIEDAVDQLPGRVSRLVRLALKRVKRLLSKILGGYRDDLVTAVSGTLLAPGAGVGWAMDHLLGAEKVLNRGREAFQNAAATERRTRARRLRKLENSNERWVEPVHILSSGLGKLWSVPIPLGPGIIVPAAPAAAAALLAWVVLVSGDQLDSDGHYPNFWKGVVQRSEGL